MGHRASSLVLGARRNAREVLLGGSPRRLSASTARTVSPVVVRCRPRQEQTGHDTGRRPALSGLSNRPLSTHQHFVACRAAARLAACSYCSDTLHFAVCLDLLCCCCRRPPGGFGELSAELELWDDARGVPVSDRHRRLTRVGADRRERGAAPYWQLCQRKPPWAERLVGWLLPPNEPLHRCADTLERFSGAA